MKILKISLFSFIIFILGVVNTNMLYSQEDDFQIWGDVSSKYKINKKFKLSAELGFRTRENSELLKQYYGELGIRYKLNKRINFSLKYRFTDYSIFDKISANRLSFDFGYSFKKWGRTSISIRERYQYSWLIQSGINNYDAILLRSRIDVNYDIRKNKIEPFFAFEHYLGLSDELLGYSLQLRWTLGASVPVNKWSDVSAAFRIQRQLNKNNPLTAYIFLLSYNIDIN